MDYVVYKRFKGKALSMKYMNLPRGTKCKEENGIIMTMDDMPLCLTTSENAYQYFARDNDGRGLQRGDLTTQIKKLLKYDLPVDFNEMKLKWQTKVRNETERVYNNRWKKVWADLTLSKYKRKDHKDFWIWNYDFYNAPISDLEYIVQILTDVKDTEM